MKKVNGLKVFSHEDVKDQILGKIGTAKRDEYEFQLQMEIIGQMIKEARTKRGMTQEELGKMIGVQKAQISKLEKSAKSSTIATIIKVFDALHAKLTLRLELLPE